MTTQTYLIPEPVEMAVHERPAARLGAFGPGALSDAELLAVLLGGAGIGEIAALALAQKMIAKAGGIAGMASWSAAEFGEFGGIGEVKAGQLSTLAEIARRMIAARGENVMLERPEKIVEFMRPLVLGLQVEKFWVLCLNRKNRLIRCVEISSGSATATIAHPREVFRAAIREGAAAVICAHNHPSGDPVPSAGDITATRTLREAARAVAIELLDHVIIGRPEADPCGRGYYSFRESAML